MFQTNFEIGFWNAWILVTICFLASVGPGLMRFLITLNFRKGSRRALKITPPDYSYDISDKIVWYLCFIMFLLFFIISIFIPIQTSTIWFYVGVSLFVIGIILVSIVVYSWASASTNRPITTGAYRDYMNKTSRGLGKK